MIEIIVPARIGSKRLPGKPLLNINGKPLILWVLDNILPLARSISAPLIVATDSEDICRVCSSYKNYVQTQLTSHHNGGLDRAFEVFQSSNSELCLVVQGDEPDLNERELTRMIEYSRQLYNSNDNFVVTPYTSNCINSCPVYIVETNGIIHYMSRSCIPSKSVKAELKHHIGMYIFSRKAFANYHNSSNKLYEGEDIELLRLIGTSTQLHCLQYHSAAPQGIDTQADIDNFRLEVSKSRY